MTSDPKVSVIMPVRDGERWLAAAMQSVLEQSLAEFELIVIDDGSIDRSSEIIEALSARDNRIRSVRHEKPQGLVIALNSGLALARAPLVARLDADDVALPDRFVRQAQCFAGRPTLVLLGSWAERIDGEDHPIGHARPETDSERLAAILRDKNPFVHSSIMMRASVVRKLGGYRNAFFGAEDFDLWLRMSEHGAIANLAEPLVRYRVHEGSTSRRFAVRQCFSVRLARLAAASRRSLGTDPAEALHEPPDWWASRASLEFYSEAAQICRFLDLADPNTTVAAGSTNDVRPPSRQQILGFSHAEKMLARRAALNMLTMRHRPATLPLGKLTAALLTLSTGRMVHRLTRQAATKGTKR